MTQLQKINDFITEYRISKPILASKMPMPLSSFKLKLSENYAAMSFSGAELRRLREVIAEMKEKASLVLENN